MSSCDIDFIKWMCEKAEYILVPPYENEVVSMSMYTMHLEKYEMIVFIDDDFKETIYYHNILQRAIEGVNKISFENNGRFEIITRRWGISLQDNKSMLETAYPFEGNPIQAKESALKYIYEQETK